MDDIGGVDNEYDEYSNEQLMSERVKLIEKHDYFRELLKNDGLSDGDKVEFHNVTMRQANLLSEISRRKAGGRRSKLLEDTSKAGGRRSKLLGDNIQKLEETRKRLAEIRGRVSMIDDIPYIPDYIAEQVAEKTVEDMHNQLDERVGEIEGMTISDQELKEFVGIFNASDVESLEENGNHYLLQALQESDPRKKQLYKSISEAAYLKADYIRVTETGESPVHNEGIKILDNNIRINESIGDLSRLERFKKWIKENWLGASALGVTVAAFITTIIVAARAAIAKGGGALGRMGNSTANSADKAGPLLKELLNIMATALKWGAAGVSWLSNNLWVLVLTYLWYVYGGRK